MNTTDQEFKVYDVIIIIFIWRYDVNLISNECLNTIHMVDTIAVLSVDIFDSFMKILME